MEEEWRKATVQGWKAEQRSRPTAAEMDQWEITVADLKVRLKLEEESRARSEICHRLAMANVKMEKYDEAISWADLGLEEVVGEWREQLLETKALALFLSGEEMKALAVLDRVKPASQEMSQPQAASSKRPNLRPADPVLKLVCSHCSSEMTYGQLRCPDCGAKVDDGFKIVRSTPNGSEDVSLHGETHRQKKFSLILTDYTVDYDDPMNFLTTHRIRSMGGEMTVITERSWYVKIGLFAQIFLYGIFALLFWKIATSPAAPLGLVVTLIATFLVFIAPLSLIYLCVVFPNFLVTTTDVPVAK
ncbi:MAG: hypothetical protein A4E30_01600 [Methanomassiliicoccales archaeon PtaB.Bin215]|nr:MAG: hypothetical protein A4E30_01600 [Methanomassiliicoccales archaeon PtaB.Bin215]